VSFNINELACENSPFIYSFLSHRTKLQDVRSSLIRQSNEALE
ncbi:hypothetical protein CCACVL1_01114, partial [Corchorus capsularis]